MGKIGWSLIKNPLQAQKVHYFNKNMGFFQYAMLQIEIDTPRKI